MLAALDRSMHRQAGVSPFCSGLKQKEHLERSCGRDLRPDGAVHAELQLRNQLPTPRALEAKPADAHMNTLEPQGGGIHFNIFQLWVVVILVELRW